MEELYRWESEAEHGNLESSVLAESGAVKRGGDFQRREYRNKWEEDLDIL